jgi:hypothetical protein
MSLISRLPLAAACLSALVLGGCCSHRVENEVRSPDERLIATEAVKNCGATMDYISEVSLRPSSEDFVGGRGVVVSYEGARPVSLRWLGTNELAVSIPAEARLLSRVDKWQDVQIRFGSDVDGAALGLPGQGPVLAQSSAALSH